MTAFGEMLPHHDNRIYLNKKVTDKWGMPVLAMDVEIKENELKMRKDMQQDAIDMFEAAGLKNVQGWDADYAPVWVFTRWVQRVWDVTRKRQY
ncbi:hypothetical protein KUC3_02930 [Alteromonas sp. KC3]|nr:hypothetical protein KUC3_02930 [Alteromonas sp. KC3]